MLSHALQECKQGEAAAINKLTQEASAGEIIHVLLYMNVKRQSWNPRLQSVRPSRPILVDEIGRTAWCKEAAFDYQSWAAGKHMGSRAPLSTLPNGSPSPNKAIKGSKAALGKPAPQKRTTPAKGRKRGPRPAHPAQTQQAKTPPSGGPAVAAPAAATQVCKILCTTPSCNQAVTLTWSASRLLGCSSLSAVAVPTIRRSAPLHIAGSGHAEAGPQQRQAAAPQNPSQRHPEPRCRHEGRPLGGAPLNAHRAD